MGLISEESSSSSYSDESGLELGLTLGGGEGRRKLGFVSPSSSSSSSSSSSYLTKTTTHNFSSPHANTAGGRNQVVGWPPVRASRMNSKVNQIKYPPNEEFQSTDKCKTKDTDIDMKNVEGKKDYIVNDEGQHKKSNFVKVYMDGNSVGRKVEMSAHSCYETLAQTMKDMFFGAVTTKRSNRKEHHLTIEATVSSKLLDGSSEFVLTYEDKDGDWMLAGDVPWGMFINSVKRLRIMRTSEATGLGSKFQVRSVRQGMPI